MNLARLAPTVLLLCAFGAWALPAPAAGSDPPPASSDTLAFWCGTREPAIDPSREPRPEAAAADCPFQGSCDDPSVRDGTSIVPRTVRIIAHVLRSPDGRCDLTNQQVQTVIDGLGQYFQDNGTGFQFQLTAIRRHDDPNAFLPPCDDSGCQSASEGAHLSMATWAEQPDAQCNIVFSCQSNAGLNGIGTLPWSADALLAGGGIWVNASIITSSPAVLPHEMGHALGLRHTFHGASEVPCSSPCAESAHDPNADRVGDFAADTPGTPTNYTCSDPPGTDCLGQTWRPTQPQNLMGYGPSQCSRIFTPQQIRRMQCWARSKMSGWLVESAPELRAAVAVRAIPNPAAAETRIAFVLPTAGHARIDVFDLLGRRVARVLDADLSAGSHAVIWPGTDGAAMRLRAGAYVVRVTAGPNRGQALLVLRP